MNVMLRKGHVRNGRVELNEPIDLPEGTEVTVTPHSQDDDGPMTEAEIARILAAMQAVQPLDIPSDVAADLDAWEARINRHGIENGERGIEHVFR